MHNKKPPSPEMIRRALLESANEETILVGGMAIDFWCKHYHIAPKLPYLTEDVDFFGGMSAIDLSDKQLANREHRVYVATMDDSSPNSGKIAVDMDEDTNPVEIDFLYRIDGLSADDIEAGALTMKIDGAPVRVMHPLLCMENKVNNIAMYPSKRDGEGIEQATLSIEIARRYLAEKVTSDPETRRQFHKHSERIFRFAARDPACFAFHAYQIDVLKAIPHDLLPSDDPFIVKRLPAAQRHIQSKREKFAQMLSRCGIDDGKLRTARFRA